MVGPGGVRAQGPSDPDGGWADRYGRVVSIPSTANDWLVDQGTGSDGVATATFDPTRVYRFRLTRTWDAGLPRVNFLMLNPSTADAHVLDPTVRRCVGFARTWGFGTLVVTNIFAFRATDPAVLALPDDPVGPGNDRAITDAAVSADRVVVAWGTRGSQLARGEQVAGLLDDHGVAAVALRATRDGYPAHPLYLRGDTVPVPWSRP